MILSDELVEREAKAMFALRANYPNNAAATAQTWEDLSEEARNYHRANTRTAIESYALAIAKAKIEGMRAAAALARAAIEDGLCMVKNSQSHATVLALGAVKRDFDARISAWEAEMKESEAP